MKKLLLTIALLVGFCLCLSAQSNPGFSYQAVARDANGKIMETQQLDLRFAIIKDDTGTGNGTIIYREMHQPTTNEFGLFNLIVGKGNTQFGDFDKVDWSQSNLWLQVDIDLNQDQRYTFMGKTRILPVPLALHAISADNVDDDDADPTNELQLLEYDATTNTLRLTDGNSVQLANAGTGNDADPDPTNEIQTITRNGLNVNLSDGGGTISVADNDNDPNNELQALSRVGDLITLSAGGGSFVDQTEDADADPTNEIQVIAFDPSTGVLSLSNGGGQIDLSSLKSGNGGSGTDDQQLTLNGSVLSIEDGNSIDLSAILPTDGDTDDQNELQTLSFDTTSYMLTLSDGNQVDLSSLKSFGNGGTTQNLSLNGSTLGITGGNTVDLSNLPDNVDDADADPQNELQVLSFDTTSLSLTLSDGNTVDLSSLKSFGNGGTTQNLSLNGTTLGITGGNNVDLSNLPDNVDDADADPMNEIQAISFDTATNILSLSNGGTVDLSSLASRTTAMPQTLTLNGSVIEISNGNSIDLANLNKDDADADPMNELQSLSLTGDSLSLSDGNAVDLSSLNKDDADADPMNELQSLSLTGDSLSLSDGNAVDLSSLSKDDADADPMNEIQMISFDTATNVLMLSNGGMVDLSRLSDGVNDADADPQNEIQAISFDTATNILSLSNGGTVDLSSLASGATMPQTLTLNGSVLEISNGNNIDLANLNKDDADADPQNEIQALNLSGNILSIDQANSVDLGLINKDDADADPNNEIQNLSLNGNTLSINQGNSVDLSNLNKDDADADPNNEIQNLSLNGTTLSINQGNSVDLANLPDNVDDADADPQNELQNISYNANNNTITLSQNGGTVDLSGLANNGGNTLWKTVNSGIEYQEGDVNLNSLSVNGFMTSNLNAYLGGTADDKGQFSLYNMGNKYLDAFVQNDGSGTLDLRNSAFRLFNANNVLRIGSYIDNDSGVQEFYGANNTLNTSIGSRNSVNRGYIGLYDEKDQLSTSLEINDQGGLITVRDSSGADAVISSVAGGAGLQQVLGANGSLNASLGSQIFNADQGALFLFDGAGTPLSSIAVNDNGGALALLSTPGNGSILGLMRDNGSAELTLNHGIFEIYSESQNLGVQSSTADDAGFLTIYGKNGNPNVGLGSFLDANGVNPNIGAVSVFDTTGNASAFLFAGAEGGELRLVQNTVLTKSRTFIEANAGKQYLYGSNNSTNIAMGTFGNVDRGAITVNDENSDIQATMAMTNEGGVLSVFRKNGDPGINTFINGDNEGEIDLFNGRFRVFNPSNILGVEANAIGGSGALNVFGANGELNAAFGNFFDPNQGTLSLYDETGAFQMLLYQDEKGGKWNIFDKVNDGGVAAYIDNSAGHMDFLGANGKLNVQINHEISSNNHGRMEFYDNEELNQVIIAATPNGGAMSLKRPNANSAFGSYIDGSNVARQEIYGGMLNVRTLDNYSAIEATSQNGLGELTLYGEDREAYLSIGAFGANRNNGALFLNNSSGSTAIGLSSNDNGGVLFVSNTNSFATITAGTDGNDADRVRLDISGGDFDVINGKISVKQDNQTTVGELYQFAGTGQLTLSGANGNNNVVLGTAPFFLADLNQGFVGVNGVDGVVKTYLSSNADGGIFSLNDVSNSQVVTDFVRSGAGRRETYGSNGSLNTVVGANEAFADRGGVGVYDAFGTLKAGMYVDEFGLGVLFADSKSFRVDHPEDETKEIWYVSMEGPEAGAYERGTSKLEEGERFIPYPEHFRLIANASTVTVQVTPLSAESMGLAVTKKTEEGFYVKELFKGTGTYDFDWEVKCVRKGHENFQVIRDKKKD